MFDLLPNLIATGISVLLPIFASYKALRTSDPAQLSPWLMYWVSFGLLTALESHLSLLLFFVPFYAYLRLLALAYLVLPQTQGARRLYQEYIHPFLAHHESRIEHAIGTAHQRAKQYGFGYLEKIVALVKQHVFGIQPAPAAANAYPAVGGAQSYAASLLARFNLPTAREGLAAPAGDFYGLLSAAAGTLQRGMASGAARDAQIEELAKGKLIPSNITDPRERSKFVGMQREKLRVLLGALDKEAGELEVGGEGATMGRSKSEASFERIDRDEFAGSQSKEGAGGWMGGWWGGKEPAPGNKEGEARAVSSGVDAGS